MHAIVSEYRQEHGKLPTISEMRSTYGGSTDRWTKIINEHRSNQQTSSPTPIEQSTLQAIALLQGLDKDELIKVIHDELSSIDVKNMKKNQLRAALALIAPSLVTSSMTVEELRTKLYQMKAVRRGQYFTAELLQVQEAKQLQLKKDETTLSESSEEG